MGRIAIAAVAVLGLVTLGLPALHRARAQGNCDASGAELDAEEQALLTLINDYRAQNGAPALSVSPALNRAAAWMVNDLGAKGYFGHQDSLGRASWTRMRDCGYGAPGGEVLAGGTSQNTGAQAFAMWRGSPSHDEDLRFAEFREIGIARIQIPGSPLGWYWAADFGYGSPTKAAMPASTPTSLAAPPPPQAAAQAASIPVGPKVVEPRIPPRMALRAGFTELAWTGEDTPPAVVFAEAEGPALAVLGFDDESRRHLVYSPLLPDWLNSLKTMLHGESYWLAAGEGASLGLR